MTENAPSPALPVAIAAAAGFAEQTLTDVQKALIAAGKKFHVICPDGGLVQGWHDGAWGHHFMADDKLADVLSADYAALILPDGANSAKTLVGDPHAKRLIKAFTEGGKPVLAVGEAVGLLAAAEMAAARRVSAPEDLQDLLGQAGAEVAAETAVTIDGNLITAAARDGLTDALEAFFGKLDAESVPQAA